MKPAVHLAAILAMIVATGMLNPGCASVPDMDRVVSLPKDITVRVLGTRPLQRKAGPLACDVTEARCAILSPAEHRDVILRMSFLPGHAYAAMFAEGRQLDIRFRCDDYITVDVAPGCPEFALRLSDEMEVKTVRMDPLSPAPVDGKPPRTVPEILLLPPRCTVQVDSIKPVHLKAGTTDYAWMEIKGTIVEPKSCQYTRIGFSMPPSDKNLPAFKEGKQTTIRLHGIRAPLPFLLLYGTDTLVMPASADLIGVEPPQSSSSSI